MWATLRRQTRLVKGILPLFVPAALLLGACAPTTEREKEYFEQREAEREARESLRSKLIDPVRDVDVIAMVSTSAAPDKVGSTAEWVNRNLNQLGGQVMFPRWRATRQGSNKFDVRFTYTIIDERNSMTKKGYSWSVDTVLNMVGPPRELVAVDVATPRGPEVTEQQRRRVRQEEFSLE